MAQGHWERYCQWYAAFGEEGTDATESTWADVCLFLWWTAQWDSWATVKVKRWAIVTELRFRSSKLEKTETWANRMEIDRTMRCVKRRQRRAKTKFPVTKAVVRRIIPRLNDGTWDGDMMCAAVTCGVELMLRTREFCYVGNGAGEEEKLKVLTVERVNLGKQKMTLLLRDTKCDPWVTVECNRADEDPTQCWFWMRRWLRRRRNEAKMQKEDYLFRWASGKPLTASQFRQRVGAAMDAAGIERQGFEGMSVRRGGATGLARAGVEDRVIAAAGRWSSGAYRLYVEVGAEELRAARMKMAGDTTIVTDPRESYCQREDGAKVHVGRMDNPCERETWNGVMSGRLEARKGGQPKAEPGAAEGEQGGR